jgi:hypothetical protein
MKFKAIGQPFTTEKKAHKKLSIENCKKFLQVYDNEKYKEFMKYTKKDDIADAFNMAIVYGLLHDKLWLDMEEYKEIIMS